jgi:hypothetical protein
MRRGGIRLGGCALLLYWRMAISLSSTEATRKTLSDRLGFQSKLCYLTERTDALHVPAKSRDDIYITVARSISIHLSPRLRAVRFLLLLLLPVSNRAVGMMVAHHRSSKSSTRGRCCTTSVAIILILTCGGAIINTLFTCSFVFVFVFLNYNGHHLKCMSMTLFE